MEAFVPALVAALFAGVGDRPASIAARLAGGNRPLLLIWGVIVLAHAAAAAVAAGLGGLIAPMLNPEARGLLVALALVFAGGGAMARVIRGDKNRRDRAGGTMLAFLSLTMIALFDATAFLTFAFAARGPSPITAALGAVVGAGALAFIAGSLGEKEWQRLPLRALDVFGGAALLAAGLVVGAGALRLI